MLISRISLPIAKAASNEFGVRVVLYANVSPKASESTHWVPAYGITLTPEDSTNYVRARRLATCPVPFYTSKLQIAITYLPWCRKATSESPGPPTEFTRAGVKLMLCINGSIDYIDTAHLDKTVQNQLEALIAPHLARYQTLKKQHNAAEVQAQLTIEKIEQYECHAEYGKDAALPADIGEPSSKEMELLPLREKFLKALASKYPKVKRGAIQLVPPYGSCPRRTCERAQRA